MAAGDQARDRGESEGDSSRERNAGSGRQGRPQPKWALSTGFYTSTYFNPRRSATRPASSAS